MAADLKLVSDAGRTIAEADRLSASLKSGSGGGTSDGMEARIARLEAHVGHIQTDIADIKADIRQVKDNARADFRVTWGGLIVGFLGMAGLLARGFGWL